MTGCRCVGDVAISDYRYLIKWVIYLKIPSTTNFLPVNTYISIFAFPVEVVLKQITTCSSVFTATRPWHKLWCQSRRLFQFLRSLRSLSSASVRNGHFLFGLFISFANTSSDFAEKFQSRHNRYDRKNSRFPREVATRERGSKRRNPCRGGGGEIFFRGQIEVK